MGLPATAAARFPQASQVRTPAGRALAIPFTFTTAAATGTAPTLGYDYNGRISIALTEGTPDTFTITVGSFVRLLSAPITHNLGATVNLTRTSDASAGTISWTCTADALASATVDGVIWIQVSES